MRLIDQFHKDEVIDTYTFVFDEVNPDGSNTMLAMGEDGAAFSQWTSGLYDPEGENDHLGSRIELRTVGTAALHALSLRLAEDAE